MPDFLNQQTESTDESKLVCRMEPDFVVTASQLSPQLGFFFSLQVTKEPGAALHLRGAAGVFMPALPWNPPTVAITTALVLTSVYL